MSTNTLQPADRVLLEREAFDILVSKDYGLPSSGTEERISVRKLNKIFASVLSGYGDATLQRLIEASDTKLGYHLHSLLRNNQPSEDRLNDWITVKTIPHDRTTDDELIINGLETYTSLTPQDHGHYPAQRATALHAIVRITAHLGKAGTGLTFDTTDHQESMVTIEDEELRDLITTHGDPSSIADLIITRNLTDSDQIKDLCKIMTNTASAINAGAL
jgi:hypothetical protein